MHAYAHLRGGVLRWRGNRAWAAGERPYIAVSHAALQTEKHMRRERDIRLKRRHIRWGSDMRRCVLNGAARREHGNRAGFAADAAQASAIRRAPATCEAAHGAEALPKRLPIANAPAWPQRDRALPHAHKY